MILEFGMHGNDNNGIVVPSMFCRMVARVK